MPDAASDPLPEIPVRDHRADGLLGHALARIDTARALLETVLGGMGPGGRLLRAGLRPADRLAERWLRRMGDPYLDEILAAARALGRPGGVAFALSYEFGCTARAFERGGDGAPTLFRTLDWPFRGLGDRVEVVRLAGPAGEWVTATWPGVLGALHGAAAGRFAAALNQAPERRTGVGRPADWTLSKLRLLRWPGLPPAHLLRRVFETAPDYAAALATLRDAPVTTPAIFTLAGTRPGETAVIERTERAAAVSSRPVAANHFEAVASRARWRPRGVDSHGRAAQIAALGSPPPVEAIAPPMLNALTRLALALDGTGALAVAGYEGERRVTRARQLAVS